MQCTPNGFLKYTELLNILQLTAAKHSELGGISFIDMQKFDLAWVLSRMKVEIIELPKWKDIISVKTWICDLENSKSVRAFEISLNEKKIIGSETFWVVFNTKSRRPEKLNLPHEHFIKYPNNRGTLKIFSKIDIPENIKTIALKKVLLSDLDMVNHVNNVKYLEWCLDYIDCNLILNKKIINLDLNFIRELSLNDEIEITNFEVDDNIKFAIFKDKKISFALNIDFN
jgi:medium-chain acyl-[acyl-carrier-protein] hydrolase